MLMFALLLGSVLCDVGGQVCFKIGVDDDSTTTLGGLRGFVLGIVRSPWIACGFVIYALEFVFWFGALTVAPLSLAIPFAALSYPGVVLASRWILRETISPRRWAASLVIAAGVAIVCWPTA